MLQTVEAAISSDRIRNRAARLFDNGPFSVTFDGFLAVDRGGVYDFLLESHDLSALFINGERVDSGPAGTHPARAAFHLRWLLPLLLSALLLAAPVFIMLRHLTRHLRAHPSEPATNRALVALIASAAGLTLTGIWWGLPSQYAWAMDEIVPANIITSLRTGVADGWLSRYPLLHFHVLSPVVLPFEFAGRFGSTDATGAFSYASAFLLMRAVSASMAIGTVYVIYLSAVELCRDRIAGLGSAVLIATSPVFIYTERPPISTFRTSFGLHCRCYITYDTLETGRLPAW